MSKYYKLTLDQDMAYWLSSLMKSIERAYTANTGLRFGSGDIKRGEDIIRQIGNVKPPHTALPFKVKLKD